MYNSLFERVEQLKCLGTTLTDQNSIQEEINCRLKSECLLSFGAEAFVFQFAVEKLKVKKYRTIILSVFFFCMSLKRVCSH